MRFRFRPLWAVLPVMFAAVALAAAACGSDGNDKPSNDVTEVVVGRTGYRGALVNPAIDKPDAVLTDTTGQPFDLQKETEGYLTLLYVGYTHCPDVCPTHLSDIATTLEGMPTDLAGKVKLVFVTADPDRDTPEVLGKYLALFNPDFVLTGSAEIDDLQRQSGSAAQKQDLGGGNYSVSHAAYVMAFTPDNVAHIVYPFGVTHEDWANDLPLLAKEGWNPS
jgi:protein SCO1/2